MTHQASMSVQRQQILGLLGVVQWVGVGVSTWHIAPPKADRFMLGGESLTTMPNPPSSQVQIEQSPKRADLVAADEPLLGSPPNDLSVHLPNLHINAVNANGNLADDQVNQSRFGRAEHESGKQAEQAVIGYELDGMRVGEWVLVVDVGVIGREEQSVWVSLKSALSTWADTHKVNFHTHHIRYPMSDELMVSQSLAQKCFDGFILRLQMMGDFTQKVAFLSALVDDVDYFGESVVLPLLSQMVHNPSEKKRLWQQVTGGSS